ncbi:unnamed protein product [Brassicogethes aeneus]|uniref:HTH CENPB-type domain-containing protein n=1 Tax=Brassicogethes aeneus TaxID=1431903 RepID=A0A9P0BC40_BRAAE|nr:unnamed protein product [Brassicogethes aeneus]
MAPRRNFHLTLKDKLDVIKKLDNGARMTDLSKIYKIPRTTMYNIKANRDKIESIMQNQSLRLDYRRTTKISKHHDMEEDLFSWYLERVRNNKTVKTEEMRETALELYEKHGHTEPFIASDGWLHRFKRRFGIVPLKHERDMQKLLQGPKTPKSPEKAVSSINVELENSNWGNKIEFVEDCLEEEDGEEGEYKGEVENYENENEDDQYEETVEEEEEEEIDKVELKPRITKEMFVVSTTKNSDDDNKNIDKNQKDKLKPRIKKEMFVGSSQTSIQPTKSEDRLQASINESFEENSNKSKNAPCKNEPLPQNEPIDQKQPTKSEEALRGIDISIEWAEQNDSNPTIMAALYKLRGDIIYKMYTDKK